MADLTCELSPWLDVFRRSASAYFQPNSISSMSRESTLKSSQGSLGVFLSQVDQHYNQWDVHDMVFRPWSSLKTPTVSLMRTLGLPQYEEPLLDRAPQTAFRSQAKRPSSKWLNLRCFFVPPLKKNVFWWQDSETQSEVETFPNYDSSDGEIVASRDPSRNHSLTSSGGATADPPP